MKKGGLLNSYLQNYNYNIITKFDDWNNPESN